MRFDGSVKFAAAIAVIAVAFSAAVYVHQRHVLTVGIRTQTSAEALTARH